LAPNFLLKKPETAMQYQVLFFYFLFVISFLNNMKHKNVFPCHNKSNAHRLRIDEFARLAFLCDKELCRKHYNGYLFGILFFDIQCQILLVLFSLSLLLLLVIF